MDNPEALNIEYTSHMRKKRKRKPRGQSRMDNPETLSTLNTQDRGQINIRENRMDDQEWTIQKHCQH